MSKFRNKYRVESSRLQKWDYGWDAAYFITICTKNRIHYFGKVTDGKMILSPSGVLADDLWHEIKNHAKNVDFGAFVVMPNHIHGILVLDGNNRDRNVGLDGNRDNGTDNGTDIGTDNGNGRDKACLVSTNPPTNPLPNPPTNPPTVPLSNPLPSPPKTPGQRRFQNQGKNTVSSIIGSYKSAVTKHTHRLGLEFDWQARFDDRIIRDDASYQRIVNYINNNPANWEKDIFSKGEESQ